MNIKIPKSMNYLNKLHYSKMVKSASSKLFFSLFFSFLLFSFGAHAQGESATLTLQQNYLSKICASNAQTKFTLTASFGFDVNDQVTINFRSGNTLVHLGTYISTGGTSNLNMDITITENSIILHDNNGKIIEDQVTNSTFFRTVNSFNIEGYFAYSGGVPDTYKYVTKIFNFELGQAPVFNINSKTGNRVTLLDGCDPTVNLKVTSTSCAVDAFRLSIQEVNPFKTTSNGSFIAVGNEVLRPLDNTERAAIISGTGLDLANNDFTDGTNSITITPGHTYKVKLIYTGLNQWKETAKYLQYKAGSVDLMIADYIEDDGFEPSGDPWGGKDIYRSPSVLNKLFDANNNALNVGAYDAPHFVNVTGNTNRMTVKIKNNGCVASDPNNNNLYSLRLFWTRSRTNELWSRHWMYDLTNNGGDNPSFVRVPWGSEITITDPADYSSASDPYDIPSIAAGATYNWAPVDGVQWFPPTPDNFDNASGQMSNGRPVICLLARINENNSANDPINNPNLYNEVEPSVKIDPYVKNNNNIATRNSLLYNQPDFFVAADNGFNFGIATIVVDPGFAINPDEPNEPATPVTRNRNICIEVVRYYNEEQQLIGYPGNFNEFGEVRLVVSNGIWDSWQNGGNQSDGIQVVENEGDGILRLTAAEGGCINNIEMDAEWTNEQAGLQFNFLTSALPSTPTQLSYRIFVTPNDSIADSGYVSSNAVIDVEIPDNDIVSEAFVSKVANITQEQMGVSIYPSPANNNIKIRTSKSNVKLNNIVISNVLGQVIYSYNTPVENSQHEIDTKDWSNGVYFITISNNNQTSTSRILIQH